MDNLRIRRKEKGFTCESLGKLINVQKSAVSKYERGEIQPSKEVLLKLAKILDCSTDYLLGRSNTPNVTLSLDTNYPTQSAEKESDQVLTDPDLIKIQRHRLTLPAKENEKMTKIMKALFAEAFPEDNEEKED